VNLRKMRIIIIVDEELEEWEKKNNFK